MMLRTKTIKPLKHQEIDTLPGELQWISIDELNCDYDYQRAHDKVNGIASTWSWDLVGCLEVCIRDNKYYVIDGGHRLEGAKLRNIDKLPCYVGYHESTKQHEAETFVKINSLRRNITPLQKMKAGLVAKDKMYVAIDHFCRKNGFIPGNSLKAIGALVTCYTTYGNYALDDALFCLQKGVKKHPFFMQAAGVRAMARLITLAHRAYGGAYKVETIAKKLARHSDKKMDKVARAARAAQLMVKPEFDCLVALVNLHDHGAHSRRYTIMPQFQKYVL